MRRRRLIIQLNAPAAEPPLAVYGRGSLEGGARAHESKEEIQVLRSHGPGRAGRGERA